MGVARQLRLFTSVTKQSERYNNNAQPQRTSIQIYYQVDEAENGQQTARSEPFGLLAFVGPWHPRYSATVNRRLVW